MYRAIKSITVCIMTLLLASCFDGKNITGLESLQSELVNANAGDTIIIKNGTYKNIRLTLNGKGSKDKPVVIIAEKPGKVFIEGESNLRLSGKYIEINGLYFRNGHSPEGPVIAFSNNGERAHNCRITNCTIDYFNPENRNVTRSWVIMYGRNNRFDHNTVVGKLHQEVTLAVALDEEYDRENNHRIDYNYFGQRPIMGSNGGETMRVGSSHHAFFSSNTIIENNVFEQCNGEVEVVSIKSSDNIVRNNTFIECRGVLALRHGNRNIVENNTFLGNGIPCTGGVRVVNEGHTIRNNFFYRLKGGRFFSALGLMNAVPNSLPNRYHHVKDVTVENNTFIECDNIIFCVGKDFERTLPPSNILLADNQFIHKEDKPVFQAMDDISGFTFKNNRVNYPKNINHKGFINDDTLLSDSLPKHLCRKDVGSSYYSLPDKKSNSGKIINIKPGLNTLQEALTVSSNGDTIVLEKGVYTIDNTLKIDKSLIFKNGNDDDEKPMFEFIGKTPAEFFTIVKNGSLTLNGLAFNGESTEKALASGAVTVMSGNITPYSLNFDNCEFYNFNKTKYAAIRAGKSTFAPKITIKNCYFHDMSAEGINLADEKDDRGKYNAEEIMIENCVFYRMLGSAINIYRGGNDESTSGPFVYISNCTLEDVDNKEQGSAMRVIGAQYANIRNCSFSNSGRGGASIRFNEMRWDDLTVSNTNIYNSGKISSFGDNVKIKSIYTLKPVYEDSDNGNFNQSKSSPLKSKGINKTDIGAIL